MIGVIHRCSVYRRISLSTVHSCMAVDGTFLYPDTSLAAKLLSHQNTIIVVTHTNAVAAKKTRFCRKKAGIGGRFSGQNREKK